MLHYLLSSCIIQMCILEFISCNRVNKTYRSLRNLHEPNGIVYITYLVLYPPWCTYLIDKVDFLFHGPVKHLLLLDVLHWSFNCQLYIPNNLDPQKILFHCVCGSVLRYFSYEDVLNTWLFTYIINGFIIVLKTL